MVASAQATLLHVESNKVRTNDESSRTCVQYEERRKKKIKNRAEHDAAKASERPTAMSGIADNQCDQLTVSGTVADATHETVAGISKWRKAWTDFLCIHSFN